MRFAHVPASEVDVEDTWHVSGLRGTGSHHVSVREVFVADAFLIDAPTTKPWVTGPLYRIPIAHALATAIAPVALGIARHALDEL